MILEVRPAGRQVISFRPVLHVAAPDFVENLCKLYHRAVDDRKVEPLLLIPAFVFDFECIHPFWDGNERIGCLLTLMLLYQHGSKTGRYSSLERLIEDSKESYYDTLHKSSQDWHEARHDLRPW